MKSTSKRPDKQGLRQSRKPFQKDMAASQKCNEEPLNSLILSNDFSVYGLFDPFKELDSRCLYCLCGY